MPKVLVAAKLHPARKRVVQMASSVERAIKLPAARRTALLQVFEVDVAFADPSRRWMSTAAHSLKAKASEASGSDRGFRPTWGREIGIGAGWKHHLT
ncbi:hypothetical protein V1281_005916 [Nitrobacteraceae bacterium AZCC 2161]